MDTLVKVGIARPKIDPERSWALSVER